MTPSDWLLLGIFIAMWAGTLACVWVISEDE